MRRFDCEGSIYPGEGKGEGNPGKEEGGMGGQGWKCADKEIEEGGRRM